MGKPAPQLSILDVLVTTLVVVGVISLAAAVPAARTVAGSVRRREEDCQMGGSDGEGTSAYDVQSMRTRLIRRLQNLDQVLEARPHDRPETLREIAWAEAELAKANERLGLG